VKDLLQKLLFFIFDRKLVLWKKDEKKLKVKWKDSKI